jgi:hypothetical protein
VARRRRHFRVFMWELPHSSRPNPKTNMVFSI